MPRTANRGVKESICRCFRCAVVPLNAAPEVQGCAKPKHQQRDCQQEDVPRHAHDVRDALCWHSKARVIRPAKAVHTPSQRCTMAISNTALIHKQTLVRRGFQRNTAMPRRASSRHAKRTITQRADAHFTHAHRATMRASNFSLLSHCTSRTARNFARVLPRTCVRFAARLHRPERDRPPEGGRSNMRDEADDQCASSSTAWA